MLDSTALVEAAQKLEPLPASVSKLAALIGTQDWSIQEAEEIIKLDQALTVRLLHSANSAASGSTGEISTVREALVRMGVGIVLSLAVGGNIRRLVKAGLPEYGLSEGGLWQHSVASALAAEAVIKIGKSPIPPEAFTAALLHDIGKLILVQFLDGEHLRNLGAARQNASITNAAAAEVEILGVHHGELGGLIAQHWQLPERLVTAITYHHTPAEANDVVCDVTYLTNQLAKRAGTGAAAPPEGLSIDRACQDRLGLSDGEVERACAYVQERLDTVLSQYDG